MKLIVALLVSLFSSIVCNAQPFGTIQAAAIQPPPIQVMDGYPTTNCVIASFQTTANGDPFGDSQGFQLTQMAFDVSATGTWIYHQMYNLHLVDEQGRVLTDRKRIWSDPIVCDCGHGRVIFDVVTNFIVYTNNPRQFTLIADIVGSFTTNSFVTVSYKQGDSRIIDLYSSVNETLRPVTRGDTNIVQISTPLIRIYPVRIDKIYYSKFPSSDTNMIILTMEGAIEPNTAYKVEVSSNLVSWAECGQITPTDSTILKEPAVGLIDSRVYKDRGFFRLKKIQ